MPNDNDTAVTIQVHDSLTAIDPVIWDACASRDGTRPFDPFTTHRFLLALETSRSVGVGTGWQSLILEVKKDGQTIAVAPTYAKTHSQGEYIFDHNWADAYERAGGRYYPKLQMAVPFTPATGRRFLTRSGYDGVGARALIEGATRVAAQNNLSSLHVTFCTQDEATLGAKFGMVPRASQQFHWLNAGYATFDDFLAALSARKRKNIRKERAQAQAFGGTIHALTGDQIQPAHWDAFWEFYQDTGARKWGQPYLTRKFFDQAQETLRDDILLVLAQRDGNWVAGALNFIGSETLFGRYWGCTQDHPCLHFEICYYQAIDYAIAHRLRRVEAGAQGAHKLARGYLPTQTHSLHWFVDAGFGDAVAQYVQAEADAVGEDIEILTSYGPFKKSDAKEQS